ncbi:hypothetical protein U9M48_030019 [Paspalum notatum var. saurae]|uniref:Uncharacterized protein n=1 Tax=Paspalum notatum var. saurae TaxID=547442 RepID=A0AAQ3X278_PASNO
MADVLVGSERRVLISGYGLPAQPPATESLLGRLDEIDFRLRQLEEQQRRPPAHADDNGGGGARRGGGAAQPAHQHVQVRGTLMDRLNLLESRIRQLSCELDLDVDGGKAAGSSSSSFPGEEAAWPEPAPVMEPAVMCATADGGKAAGGGWSAVEILQRGARQLHHRSKPNPPNKAVKSLKDAKCACQKEKRKAERGNKASRRWFMV